MSEQERADEAGRAEGDELNEELTKDDRDDAPDVEGHLLTGNSPDVARQGPPMRRRY